MLHALSPFTFLYICIPARTLRLSPSPRTNSFSPPSVSLVICIRSSEARAPAGQLERVPVIIIIHPPVCPWVFVSMARYVLLLIRFPDTVFCRVEATYRHAVLSYVLSSTSCALLRRKGTGPWRQAAGPLCGNQIDAPQSAGSVSGPRSHGLESVRVAFAVLFTLYCTGLHDEGYPRV